MSLSGKRVANPFPDSEWAKDAYQNAAYMSVTMGLEFDAETGEIATLPHSLRGKEPLRGNPGAVLSNEDFVQDIGHIPTEIDRLNLAFMLGYCLARLEALKEQRQNG
jgi:hypothetical protein